MPGPIIIEVILLKKMLLINLILSLNLIIIVPLVFIIFQDIHRSTSDFSTLCPRSIFHFQVFFPILIILYFQEFIGNLKILDMKLNHEIGTLSVI